MSQVRIGLTLPTSPPNGLLIPLTSQKGDTCPRRFCFPFLQKHGDVAAAKLVDSLNICCVLAMLCLPSKNPGVGWRRIHNSIWCFVCQWRLDSILAMFSCCRVTL